VLPSASKVARAYRARREPNLDHWGLDGLVEGKPTVLYHGTTRLFRRFDLSRARGELVERFYGRGIFLTPKKAVAGQYADANRNIGFDPEVLDDLKRINPEAGAFAWALYRKGSAAWDDYDWNALAHEIGGVDPNDVGDLVDYVIGSKTEPARGDEPVMFFNQSTGMPGYVYDLLDTLGIKSFKYRPKVYTVSVKVSNPLITDSQAEARRARSNGYDSVVYHGPNTVDHAPEVAVFDPSRVRIRRVERW
jgi:hypothetical protein